MAPCTAFALPTALYPHAFATALTCTFRRSRVLRLSAMLLLSTAMTACSSRSSSEKGPADAKAQAALDKAEAAALELGRTLRSRVSSELAAGGPASAVEVCTQEAQKLTANIAERTGVTVGRSSLRLRQPDNEPPAWVTTWLSEQGERSANEATPLNRIDSTSGGRMARVIRPIATEPFCLVCHGAPESLPTEVTTRLENAYPGDRATGYAVGDLRGALWAEVRVDGDDPE